MMCIVIDRLWHTPFPEFLLLYRPLGRDSEEIGSNGT